MNRRTIIAIVILLVFGAVRLPFEQQLSKDLRAAHFHGARLDLNMREQVGQMAFLAALMAAGLMIMPLPTKRVSGSAADSPLANAGH